MSTRDAAAPAVALGGLVAGILAGERLGPAPAVPALCAGSAALGLAWFTRTRAAVAIAAVALLLVGAAATQRALDGLAGSPVAALAERRPDVVVRGTLVDDPGGPQYRAEVLVRAREVSATGPVPVRAPGGTVLVRATGTDAARLRALAAGDRAVIAGVLEPLDGFDAPLRHRHVVARVASAELRAFAPPSSPLFRVANRLRAVVTRGSASLPRDERALLAGFLLGDTRDVAPDVRAAFRDAGLSHLLAVSGANVAFVLALVSPLLRRLAYPARTAAGLTTVVLFAAMTRFEPSVLRASALAGLVMLAGLAGRPAARLRLLLLAITVLLVVDPFLLHVPGFLLSCASTLGIVLLAPGLSRRLALPRLVREPVAVSLSAQVAVLPVLLPLFGPAPAVAPLANLLAVPVAEPLAVLGLLAGAAGGLAAPSFPAFAALLHLPLRPLLAWVATIARVAAGVPARVDARAALAALAVAAAWAAVRRGRAGSLRGDARGTVPDAPPR